MTPDLPYDELAVKDWEIEERRVHIPSSLAEMVEVNESILRVPRSVDEKIRVKHPQIVDQYLNLNVIVHHWDSVRFRDGRIEVYLEPDNRGNRTLFLMGYDRNGSFNLISMYQVRSRNWRNRALISRGTR